MREATRVNVVPEATHESISAHCKRRGISRGQAYKDLAAGKYQAVKYGRKTLIVVATANRYYASLPSAKFKPPRAKRLVENSLEL